ncbi:CENPF protein, partial [Polypterus senegalus]
MSWAVEEWKEGLPTRALQKIQDIEGQLDKLKKERQQRQFQLESLEAAFQKQKHKVENEKSEAVALKRENQSLVESCDSLEKSRQKISHELQMKEQQMNCLEGQLASSKKQADKLEQEIKRYKYELERIQKSQTSCDSQPCRTPQESFMSFSTPNEKIEELQEKYNRECEERKRLEAELKVLQVKLVNQSSGSHKDIARHQAASSVFPWQKEQVANHQSGNSFETPNKRGNSTSGFPWEQVPAYQQSSRSAKKTAPACNPSDGTSSNPQYEQLKTSHQELKARVCELENQLKSQEKDIKCHLNKVQEMQSQYEKVKLQLNEKDKGLSKSKDELARVTGQYDQMVAKCAALEQKMKQVSEELNCQRHNADSTRLAMEQKLKDQEKGHQKEVLYYQNSLQNVEQQLSQMKIKTGQELQQAKNENNSLRSECDKAAFQKQHLEKDLDDMKQKFCRLEQTLQSSQAKENSFRIKYEEMQKENARLSSQFNQSSKRLIEVEEQLKNSKQTLQQTSNLAEDFKTKHAAKLEEIKSLNTKLDEQTKRSTLDVQNLKNNIAELEKVRDGTQVQLKKKEQELEQMRMKQLSLEEERKTLQAAISAKQKQWDELKRENESLTQWKNEKENLIKNANAEKENLLEKNRSLTKNVEVLQNKTDDQHKQITHLESLKNDLWKEVETLKAELVRKSADLEEKSKAYEELSLKEKVCEEKHLKELHNAALSVSQLHSQVSELEVKLKEENNKALEAEHSYNELRTECETKTDLVKSKDEVIGLKDSEIQHLQSRNSQIILHHEQMLAQINEEKCNLIKQHEDTIAAKSAEMETMQLEYVKIQQDSVFFKDQVVSLESCLNVQNQLSEDLQKRNEELCRVNEQINLQLSELEKSRDSLLEDVQLKIDQIQSRAFVHQTRAATLHSSADDTGVQAGALNKVSSDAPSQGAESHLEMATCGLEEIMPTDLAFGNKYNLLSEGTELAMCEEQTEQLMDISDVSLLEPVKDKITNNYNSEPQAGASSGDHFAGKHSAILSSLRIIHEKCVAVVEENARFEMELSEKAKEVKLKEKQLWELSEKSIQESEKYAAEIQSAEEKVSSLKQNLETLQGHLNNKTREADELAEKVSIFEHEVRQLQCDLLVKTEELTKLQELHRLTCQDKELLEKQLTDLQNEFQILQSSSSALETQLEAAKRQLELLESKLASVEAESQKSLDTIKEKENVICQKNVQIEMLQMDIEDKDECLSACSAQIEELQHNLSLAETKCAENDLQKSNAEQELKCAQEELQSKTNDILKMNELIKSLKKEHERSVEEKCQALCDKIETSQGIIEKLQCDLQEEAKVTRETNDKYEELIKEKCILESELSNVNLSSRLICQEKELLEKQIIDLQHDLQSLKSTGSALQRQLEEGKLKLEELESKLLSAEAENQKNFNTIKENEDVITQKNAQIKMLQKNIEDKDECLSCCTRQIEELQHNLSTAERKLGEACLQKMTVVEDLKCSQEQLRRKDEQISKADELINSMKEEHRRNVEEKCRAVLEKAEADQCIIQKLQHDLEEVTNASKIANDKCEQLTQEKSSLECEFSNLELSNRLMCQEKEVLEQQILDLQKDLEMQLQETNAKLQRAESALHTVEAESQKNINVVKEHEDVIKQKDVLIDMLQKNIEDRDERLSSCLVQIEQLQHTVSATEKKCEESELQKSNIQKELNGALEELAKKDFEISKSQELLESIKETFEQNVEEKCQALLEQLRTHEQIVEKLQSDLQEETNVSKVTTDKYEQLAKEKSHLEYEMTSVRSQLAAVTEQNNKLVEDLQNSEHEVSLSKAESLNLQESLLKLKEENTMLQSSLGDQEKRIETPEPTPSHEELKRQYNQLESLHHELKEKFALLQNDHLILQGNFSDLMCTVNEQQGRIENLVNEEAALLLKLDQQNGQMEHSASVCRQNETRSSEQVLVLTDHIEAETGGDVLVCEPTAVAPPQNAPRSPKQDLCHVKSNDLGMCDGQTTDSCDESEQLHPTDQQVHVHSSLDSAINLVNGLPSLSEVCGNETEELKVTLERTTNELNQLKQQHLVEMQQWESRLEALNLEMESKLAEEKQHALFLSSELEAARLQMQGLDLSSHSLCVENEASEAHSSPIFHKQAEEIVKCSHPREAPNEHWKELEDFQNADVKMNQSPNDTFEGLLSDADILKLNPETSLHEDSKLVPEVLQETPLLQKCEKLCKFVCEVQRSQSPNDTFERLLSDVEILKLSAETSFHDDPQDAQLAPSSPQESPLSQARKNAETSEDKFQNLFSQISTLREEVVCKSEMCSAMEAKVQEIDKEKSALQGKLDSILISNHELIDQVKEMEKEASDLRSQMQISKVEFSDVAVVLENLEKSKEAWHEKNLELQNDLKRSRSEKANLEKHILSLEADIEEFQNKNHKLEKDIEFNQKNFAAMEKQLSLVTSERNQISEEFCSCLEEKEDLERTSQALKEKLKLLESDHTNNKEFIKFLEVEITQQKKMVQVANSDLDAAKTERSNLLQNLHDWENKIAVMSSEKDELLKQLNVREEEKNVLSSEREALEGKLKMFESENVRLSQSLENSLIEKGEIASRLDSTREEVAQMRQGIEKLKAKIESDEKKRKHMEEQIKTRQRKIDSLLDKIEKLERELEESEGHLETVVLQSEERKEEAESLLSEKVALSKSVASLQSEVSALQSEKHNLENNANQNEEALKEEVQTYRLKVESLQEKNETLERELEVNRKQLQDSVLESETAKTHCKELSSEKGTLLKSVEHLEMEVCSLRNEKDKVEKELLSVNEKVSQTDLLLSTTAEALENLQKEKADMLKNHTSVVEELSQQLSEVNRQGQDCKSELHSWRLKNEELTTRLSHLETEKNELSRQMIQSQATYEELQGANKYLTQDLEALQIKLNESTEDKERLLKSIADLQLLKHTMDGELSSLEKEKENWKKSQSSLQNRVTEAEDLITKKEATIGALQNSIKQLEKELQSAKSCSSEEARQMSDLKEKNTNLQNEMNAMRNASEDMKKESELEREALATQLQEHQQQTGTIKLSLEASTLENRELNVKLLSLQSELETNKRKHEQVEKEYQQKLEKQASETANLKSKINQLKKKMEASALQVQQLLASCKQLESEKEAQKKENAELLLKLESRQNPADSTNKESLRLEIEDLQLKLEEKTKEADESTEKYCNLMIDLYKLEESNEILEKRVALLNSQITNVKQNDSQNENKSKADLKEANQPKKSKEKRTPQQEPPRPSVKRQRVPESEESDKQPGIADIQGAVKRIKGSAEQSAATEDAQFHLEGLPELVRKGFADIPVGEMSPYVIRRTTVQRCSPRLAAKRSPAVPPAESATLESPMLNTHKKHSGQLAPKSGTLLTAITNSPKAHTFESPKGETDARAKRRSLSLKKSPEQRQRLRDLARSPKEDENCNVQ